MIWTRKSLTKTSGWFNQKPLALLDETLRLPLAMEEILRLFGEEYGINLKKKPLIIHNGYFYFRPYRDYFFQLITQPKVYLILWRLIRETQKAKDEWENDIKEFLKEFNQLKRQNLVKLNSQELLEYIKKTVKFDACWLFKLGFGMSTLYHYFSEVLLKFLYRLLVKDKHSQNYHELVIGYPNKLKEADLAFWQVVEGKLSQDDYLEKYGYRSIDVSLVIPTIGEDKNSFREQIESFRKFPSPDFKKKHKEVLAKRKSREKYVNENFRSRIPFSRLIFNEAIDLAQRYIPIRETRRFYYTKPTFLIRKSLLELGSRFKLLKSPEDVFFLTREELEKAVFNPKEINKQRIQSKINKRKRQWKEQGEQVPSEEMEL